MRPLPLLALGTCFGSFAFPFLQPSPLPLALAGCALGACTLLARGRSRALKLGLFGFGLILGLMSAARLPPPLRLRGECDVWVRIETAAMGTRVDGWVAAARCDGVDLQADGRIRLRFRDIAPPPGTWVRVEGKATGINPVRLPGEPDPVPAAIRAGVESELSVRTTEGLPPRTRWEPPATHAGLLRAMVDGDRSGIPEETRTLLRNTGTWHLVSISGLHLGLVAAVAAGIGWLLSRPLVFLHRPGLVRLGTAVFSTLAVVAYADLAGWPQPARRAVWMVAGAGVLLAAARRPAVLDLLAMAAVGGVMAEPDAIDNPSFLLSYGAMLGMVLIPGRLLRWLPLDTPRLIQLVLVSLAGTVGATLGTLPIVAWIFQDLPVTGPLANLWAVPWIATIATPAALLARVLPGDPGLLALAVADSACTIGLGGLSWLYGPMWHPAVGPWGALAIWLAFLGLRRDLPGMILVILVVISVRSVPRQLEVRYLAIGQGDAALIRFPDGRNWLIDGGPGGDDLLHTLRRLGVHQLDDVVLSHPHPDHLDGLLPVLRSLPVHRLHVGRLPEPGEDNFYEAISLVPDLRVGLHPLDGATLLHPTPDFAGPKHSRVNDESLVLLLTYGQRRFLFTGDIEEDGERALAAHLPDVDVLKAAHHGSRTSSTPPMRAADPEVVVVSCGWESRYKHPHPQALSTWRDTEVWRTDLRGTVLVRTDGISLTVEAEDPPVRWRLDQQVRPTRPFGSGEQRSPGEGREATLRR